jgi:hypothetical protein
MSARYREYNRKEHGLQAYVQATTPATLALAQPSAPGSRTIARAKRAHGWVVDDIRQGSQSREITRLRRGLG